MKKILIAVILLIPLTFGTTSCEISQQCSTALCDLTTRIVLGAGATTVVPAGGVMTFINVVKNVKDVTAKCETEIAAATNTLMNVKFASISKNGANDYKIIFNDDNNPIPEIAPDMKSEETYEFTFNNPGDYIIVTSADNRNTANERDESNNDAPPFQGTGSKSINTQKGIKITVLPNPNFQKKAGVPPVEIKRISVKVVPQ